MQNRRKARTAAARKPDLFIIEAPDSGASFKCCCKNVSINITENLHKILENYENKYKIRYL